jgi:nucleotide-binding universal stress UspA family protein
MRTKILLCTDGSLDGLRAVRLGAVIAAQLQAEVALLCVVESDRRGVEDSLKRAATVVRKSVDGVQLISRRGKLVDQMLAQLLQVEYDLVVVGYHLRSFLEKVIWGSLAARIAHEVPVSVLIVRGRRDWIEHVLIGISGGGFTDACAEWGSRIAAAFGARVTLLHVSPSPPLMYGGLDEVVETLAEFLETDTPGAQALRRVVATLTELDVQTDVELARGLPERELLRLAQNRDTDLLVVGSSWAAQPAHRLFVRNITEQVLINTQRPVLVVRPSAR